MLGKIIEKFVGDICKYNSFSKEQEEQINYSLKTILYEIIKFIFIIIIFSFLGYFKETALVLLVMILTKPFIGGYHEDTQLRCFIATVVLVFFIIYLAINIKLDFISTMMLNSISIFAIYNKAPVIDSRMPLTKDYLIRKNRRIGITNTIFISIISVMIFTSGIYSQVLIWTIVVQAILMFNKREE